MAGRGKDVMRSSRDGKTPANVSRGAGKSIPPGYAWNMEGSGPRHTRSRGVDASVRRNREATRMSGMIVDEPEPEGSVDLNEEEYLLEDDDAGDPYDDDFEVGISGPRVGSSSNVVRIKKGKDGRFVSTGSSSKNSKKQKQSGDESWLVKRPMPGGPQDGSVIPSYGGHVATRIWDGDERNLLRCMNRANACVNLVDWRARFPPALRDAIDKTAIAHLPYCMFKHIDVPLICAFVERWQPDTNSFHLPFGEMTIMLHDVWQILRIPVDGSSVSAQSTTEQMQLDFMELLGVALHDLQAPRWSGGGVLAETIFEKCFNPRRPIDVQGIGWMTLMLGSTLFVDKSGSRIRACNILEVKEGLEHICDYSWGGAALAYMYRQLGIASRSSCAGICGCLTLLQAWIYEYFPCFRPHRERLICNPQDPRACMWSIKLEPKDDVRLQTFRNRLDQMTAEEVTWLPYGRDPVADVPRTLYIGCLRYRDIIEPYMPDRVLRQLGYMQVIPSPAWMPDRAYRPANSIVYCVEFSVATCNFGWAAFPTAMKLNLAEFKRSEDPSVCAPDYLSWFYRHSHPRIMNQDMGNFAIIPDRTNSAWWVNKMLNIFKPIKTMRDKQVDDESTAAIEEMIAGYDDFVRQWSQAK